MTNASGMGPRPTTEELFVVAAAPAGWYEVGDGLRRWFDGRQWTDHYAPVLSLVSTDNLVRTNHPTNHGFHLIMAIMTLGAWTLVWAVVAACNIIRSTAPAGRG